MYKSGLGFLLMLVIQLVKNIK